MENQVQTGGPAPAGGHRSIQQVVPVTFHYPVHFCQSLFDPANPLLMDVLTGHARGRAKALCFIDDGVLLAHPGLADQIQAYFGGHAGALNLAAPPLPVPGGETCKQQPGLVLQAQAAINEYGIDRHSFVLAVGGGAVLDMLGYAAATAHRGVRLIRIPTTVLSQNDSGIGVKNSVNAFGKKNWLGTFAPPYAVLNDRDFLVTLQDRDWNGGLSEAVKVALLKDAVFFDWLSENARALAARDREAMDYAVYRCAQLHLKHISGSGDPFEAGSSRPLDFGHWAAHKLESMSRYQLRHGEAVAIGLALDCTYSALSGLLPESEWRRIVQTIKDMHLAVYVPELATVQQDERDPDGILGGLKEFREHLGGQLTISLLRAPGQPLEVHEMDAHLLRRSVQMLQAAQNDPIPNLSPLQEA